LNSLSKCEKTLEQIRAEKINFQREGFSLRRDSLNVYDKQKPRLPLWNVRSIFNMKNNRDNFSTNPNFLKKASVDVMK
jgi:hypothetical protein